MKQYDIDWTSETFEHSVDGIETTAPLAMLALGVLHRHFLCPMSSMDLLCWKNHDGYRHHLDELEEDPGDEVRIKPWIMGHGLENKETIFEFEASEFMEEVFKVEGWKNRVDWKHRRGVLLGVLLVITTKEWSAVFGFRLNERTDAKAVHDLPVREALCLSLDADEETVAEWLAWAFEQNP